MTDNYFASKVRFFGDWDDVSFANNSIIRRETTRVVQFEKAPSNAALGSYAWDDNHYVSDSSQPFAVGNQLKAWAQWRDDFGLDAGSTIAGAIEANFVDVRPNRYEAGRGHAVVYNWQELDAVEIDLSSVVSIGASFQIFNVLDSDHPVLTGIYSGGTVSVAMEDVVAQPPRGHLPNAPLVVNKEFSTFLILSEAPSEPATGNEFYVSIDGTSDGEDLDAGDNLTYSARLSNGEPLPQWLTFHGNEGYFVGTPTGNDAGVMEIELTASDLSGATVTDTFHLVVRPLNGAPQVVTPIADILLDRGEDFQIDVSENFTDSDTDDPLAFSLSNADGTAPPAWLMVEPETGLIHGRATEVPQTLALRVTATDASGLSTSDVVHVTVSEKWAYGADLAIALQGPNVPVVEGDDVTYVITVTNRGPEPATGVRVTHVLPDSTTFASASVGCQAAGQTLTCSVAALPTDGEAEFVVTATTTATGSLESDATVSTSTEDPDESTRRFRERGWARNRLGRTPTAPSREFGCRVG